MNIKQDYLPSGTRRRSGAKLLGTPKFIVCHDTGNPESTAAMNVSYFKKSANEDDASAHAFVDDKGVIEEIPLEEKAWHVRRNVVEDNNLFGVDSNDWSIGVELCYFPSNLERSKTSYQNYVEYISSLCMQFGLDPKTKLVGHYVLDPSRRNDPINAFSKIGKTWQAFVEDVSAHFKANDKDLLAACQVTNAKYKSFFAELLELIRKYTF